MKCRCNYNPESYQTKRAAKLECPEWMKKTMRDEMLNEDIITIDNCMKDTILQLWNDKITTLNCCCGHGKVSPFIIVLSDQNIEDVFKSIKKVDGRDFGVGRWSKDKEREMIYYFELHKPITISGNEWDRVEFLELGY